MSKLERAGISRREFVGVGLSAAFLASGISPFAAKAQTVGFGAATTGRLSDYCRGDGRDETEQINQCFAEHLIVEIDEPSAGVGYGFRVGDGGGIWLRSGQEVSGRGAASKLLRVGRWQNNSSGFKNRDRINGDSSIRLNNIHMHGFRYEPDVPEVDSNALCVGISIRSQTIGKFCDDIRLTGVEVHDWPGISSSLRNASNVMYQNVKSINPSRGGINFYTSKYIDLSGVRSFGSGDDAIAFYAAATPVTDIKNYRPVYGITMDGCEARTRKNPQYGAALKFGGSREAEVANCRFTHAKNSLVQLMTYPNNLHPTDIHINDCDMIGGERHSLHITADVARRISARRNYMHLPGGSCVYVITPDGKPAAFEVAVRDNVLSKPGSSRHISVQENLSGVDTRGNRRVYGEYTTRPTLSLVTPKPGSSVQRPVGRIEAVAKASVSRLENDLQSKNVKLFINGAWTGGFDYYRSGKLIKRSPRLRPGKNTVAVEVTCAAETTTKTWTFTAR